MDSIKKKYEEAIPQYLREVSALNKESARSHRFAMLVHELLSLEPEFIENYISGIETSLKTKEKDRILRGEADNLFGNVIIEFEANLSKTRSEAEEQLRRYTAILWSNEPPERRTPYLCIATDGVRFIVFSPVISRENQKLLNPEDLSLKILEASDWTKLKPLEVFYWIDRYFLRKEILVPTSETIVRDFGVNSHAFQTITSQLISLWQLIKGESSFTVVYENWQKYLNIVYGGEVGGEDLFIRHTYLATLAKLMSWMKIIESQSLPEESEIMLLLKGELFKTQGIENFIEEDFFSWIGREPAAKPGVCLARLLFSLLQNYNFNDLSEDILKSLYQALVDPETRHDLGEFYTPDWLAHRIINKLLDQNPEGAMLDPACGSGTFLYLAIQEKRKRLGDSDATLCHLLSTVCGADIHPLAVMVAKSNYILALGDLLRKRKRSVNIPVYLADTLKLPQRFMRGKQYEIAIDSQTVYVHEELLDDITLFDDAIEHAKEFARHNKNKNITLDLFKNYLRVKYFPILENKELVRTLYEIAETLKYFIDHERDTIWAFVLKNIYKPLFLRGKFDWVMGNPPWIAFRFLDPAYQKFVKDQVVKEYKLLSGRGELITHLEVASIFLARAADIYLKSGGQIAFVLPKSIFTADQHDALRKGSFQLSEDSGQKLAWQEVWDCEKVTPLFNVPSCVLIGKKSECTSTVYPIAGQIISGKLKRKNASLNEAEEFLNSEHAQFALHSRGKRSFLATGESAKPQEQSYYKDNFSQGVSIVPRSFWFVDVNPLSESGIDLEFPPIETSERTTREAKAAYKSVFMQGQIEACFIYSTLLASGLLPFGHLGYRMIVLPIIAAGDHYQILDGKKAHQMGYYQLQKWLEKAERELIKRRGAKADKMSLYERLDYRKKLTNQNPQYKYKVIYNTSGTYLAAAIIRNKPYRFHIKSHQIIAQGFIADTKLYYCDLNDRKEAFFLVSILNAPVIDHLLKPMQSRGLFGPRDIHKKVLELPIPQFNPKNDSHQRLVELGRICSDKVEKWLASRESGKSKGIGNLRAMTREMLKEELAEIDKLVKKDLGV